jgi:hypothetical protein
MARDPAIQHDESDLREGLAAAEAGEMLDDRAALREELVFLGLLRVGDADGLHLTPEGRRFLRKAG